MAFLIRLYILFDTDGDKNVGSLHSHTHSVFHSVCYVSFLSTCSGGVLMTSREFHHPIRMVRPITPKAIRSISKKSKANVISKKNLARSQPPASDRIIPVSAENKPR